MDDDDEIDANSLVIDGAGGIHIAYHDNCSDGLKYATSTDGTTWSISHMGTENVVFFGNRNLAVTATGKIHVVYHDSRLRNLRLASSIDGATWSVTTIDSLYTTVDGAALVLDDADGLHVSYIDTREDTVKYAYSADGSTWEIYTASDAEAPDSSTTHTAIALSSSRQVYLTYKHNTLGLVSANSSDGITWSTNVINATHEGFGHSLTIDSSDNLHVASWSHLTTSDLIYATSTDAGATWTTSTVDSDGFVGFYPTIAVGTDGTRHILYFDWSEEYFQYASLSPAPTADAGADQKITFKTVGAKFILDGSASSGAGTLAYSWAVTTKPIGARASILTSRAAKTTVSVTKRGIYVFKLTVTDADGNAASDTVTVTVR